MLTLANAIESLLFEKPLPIVIVLVVVWAGMRLVGVRLLTDERAALGKRLRAASWGMLAIAALVLGMAWYVKTPCEQVRASMRQLLAAVEQEDWQAFDRLTADDATARYLGVEFTRASLDNQLQGLTVEDITLLSEAAACDETKDIWITTVRIRVQAGGSWEGLEGLAGLDISVWGVQWQRRADGGWEAVRFEHEGSGVDASLVP